MKNIFRVKICIENMQLKIIFKKGHTIFAMSKILSFHYLIPGTLLTSEQETTSFEIDSI